MRSPLAAGAGLGVLATATTAAYFLVAYGYPGLAQRLPRSRWASQWLRLTYLDGVLAVSGEDLSGAPD